MEVWPLNRRSKMKNAGHEQCHGETLRAKRHRASNSYGASVVALRHRLSLESRAETLDLTGRRSALKGTIEVIT